MTVKPIVIGAWYNNQKIGTGTGGLWNERSSVDEPNYSIIMIGQNTEESPGDLRKLAVTQTQVKDNRISLVWKTLKKEK